MNSPSYVQVLWSYRWFLAAGIVVAVLAGLVAGFTVRDGEVTLRAERTYEASTTVLVDRGRSTLFQSEIVGEEAAQAAGQLIQQDLSSIATIYAYLAASEQIRARVEGVLGPLADNEAITAVSRTTQPAGDEQFPGRLSLPILDIIGVSSSLERAEEISRTANDEFQAYVLERQNEEQVQDQIRVSLTTLQERAGEGEGSNPAIPVVLAGGAVLLMFLALTFVIHAIRTNGPTRGGRDKPTGERSRRSRSDV